MDILAHTLWANAGARGANAVIESKNKKFRLHVGWTAFFGVAPDLFAFTLPFIIVFYKMIFLGNSFSAIRNHHGAVGGFDIASYLYQFSHSLIIFSLVFILVWILSKRPRFELLGWALHILIDIPSHSLSFYPTPFLFPVSEYRFPYGVQWSNMIYMIVNYSFLAIFWIYILIKKNLKKRIKNVR